MKKVSPVKGILKALNHYLIFFLLIAFIITCCTMLFVTTLSKSLGVTLTQQNISVAAKLTFANVVLLSFIVTVIDRLRRKLTVERPVKMITEATNKIIEGDFSVRIKPVTKYATDDSFNEIIECINKIAEELSGVETLRSDFIANISHEMKTPLTVMQNYGTLLQTPGLSEEKRLEYANGIIHSSRRLSEMMTNILKLNRLENQQIFPETARFDLGEQLCECLLQFENTWEQKKIEIETDIAENIKVEADSELLSLVWNNLFSNAFKFTDEGGTVSLSLTATEHHAIIRVSDTGCGMTPEIGARIFEKFYQGDPSRAVQGNGLGLALVKRIIDIMHGEISVESAVGIGTTFTVKIRRVESEL